MELPKTPRSRVPNFTSDEKVLLAALIKSKPIMKACCPTVGKSVDKKKAAWEAITKEFNCQAHVHKRAKTQLQSMLLMNLEARPVVFEDVGRQVLATGRRKPPHYFIHEIEKITAEDITRVARRMLGKRPAVAARGKLAHLPSYEEIQANMAPHAADARAPGRRINLFRN